MIFIIMKQIINRNIVIYQDNNLTIIKLYTLHAPAYMKQHYIHPIHNAASKYIKTIFLIYGP